MLKDYVSMLQNRMEKEGQLIEAARAEFERRKEFNRKLKEEFESIGAEVPGFENDDPII